MSKAQQAVEAAREFAATIDTASADLGNARIHLLRLADALEAAYDQMESFAEAGLLDRINGQYEPSASMFAALEAAQRPTISPEVRGRIIEAIHSVKHNAYGVRHATDIADAFIARFTLPELDPEKVAELLATHDWDAEREACTCRERGWSFEHVADMLIADLPGLTKNGDV